jgi:hypothetical protein
VSPGVAVTSVDDLKSLIRRFVDEFQSQGDEAVADELLADTFTNHTAPPVRSTRGALLVFPPVGFPEPSCFAVLRCARSATRRAWRGP